LSENIGLCLVRQGKKQSINCLVTQNIICRDLVTNHTYIFPLYIYNEEKEKSQQKSLSGEVIKSESGKQPNFTEDFIEFIEEQYPNQKITPEDILGYIYAVLHSPTYREKFNEFLKIDFPRIPFVKDFRVFKQLSKIGMELIYLHLMKTELKTNTKFDVQGSDFVNFVKYEDNTIHINKDQFFDGVPENAWDFYIGGYKVLDKWLKSRKNRELGSSEIEQFIQIVEIINQTIGDMKEIEKIEFL
jgi:Predicted helicase